MQQEPDRKQTADNIEANADNTADTMEANVDNAADTMQANAENAADAVRNAGDNKADAVRNGAATNNASKRNEPVRSHAGGLASRALRSQGRPFCMRLEAQRHDFADARQRMELAGDVRRDRIVDRDQRDGFARLLRAGRG